MTWHSRTADKHRSRTTSAVEAGSRVASMGFTLIEVIAVIAILGLALSVVASFAPRRHGGLDLVNAADGLVETLRSARAKAIARQTPVLFAPTTDGRGYAVDGIVRALPAAIVLTAETAIRFAPDGSSSGGVLRLASDGSARVLRVDWLTSQVSATHVR